jgi:hypothetical protein
VATAVAGCQSVGQQVPAEGSALISVPADRFEQARNLRRSLSTQIQTGERTHPTNGDEQALDGYIGNYGKALPHNDRGEHDPAAYERLVAALRGEADFDDIPLGQGRPLANPQAMHDFTAVGADVHELATAPAPAFESAEAAGEMVELYWQALTRDVPFQAYPESDLIADARAELAALDGYAARTPTDRPQYLFTGNHPHAQQGPYISQFLYRKIPRGQVTNDQAFKANVAGQEYLTEFDEWLAVQRGAQGRAGTSQYRETERYITTGRDLATFVHGNAPYQSFLNAALILLGEGAPFDPGNPFLDEVTQNTFLDLGPITLTGEIGGVLQPVQRFNWYSKWGVHRRLRPEEFGGRVHVDRTGRAAYPFHDQLRTAEAVDRVADAFGTALLPQAYPEGSPTHPSYPAGHAGIAGACGGIVKALFDTSATLDTVVRPTPDGRALEAIDASLTIEAELNKLQFNHYLGRNWAGIHYRSDGIDGHLLGERVAAAYLNGKVALMDRDNIELTLPTVDGAELTIDGDVSRSYEMPASDR